MRLLSWLRSTRSLFAPNGTKKGLRPNQLRKRSQAALLSIERLEDRTVPTTFMVLNLADSGDGSLRAAIAAANTQSGSDVIRFAPAARDGTITLTSGELPITDHLEIDGPGADRLAVSGNDASRVFRIDLGATVSIDDLTVTHGRVLLHGGGIRNDGTLTLSRAIVSDNEVVGLPGVGTVVDALGGGIFNTGNLTVRNTHFEGNRATGGDSTTTLPGGAALGGAIMSLGSATAPAAAVVSQSTFVDNQAVGGKASPTSASTRNGLGGAIMNDAGTFDISFSQFHNNRAIGGSSANTVGGAGSGGAIANVAFAGDAILSIRNSAFTGNQAIGGAGGAGSAPQIGRGGAIANLHAPFPSPTTVRATATITHSFIIDNRAVGGAGVIGGIGQGGGISNENGGSLIVSNSTLALNRAIGGAGIGGTAGNGLGGGIFNGMPIPSFGTPTLTLQRCLVAINRAEGGAATGGGTSGQGIGGGLYVAPGSVASADPTTFILANDATMSDDDVFGSLTIWP